MPRFLRVFLSHASNDKPLVIELYNALKSERWIDPWLDKAKILPGQDWEMVIEKAVDDSDVVIICLSNHSVSKEGFVQREIRYAYDIALEKPEDTIYLIPVRLNACNVPRKLRSFHWVDYFGTKKRDAYTDLLESLKLRYDQILKREAQEMETERKVQSQGKTEEEKSDPVTSKITRGGLENKQLQSTSTDQKNFEPTLELSTSSLEQEDKQSSGFPSSQSLPKTLVEEIKRVEDFQQNLLPEYDVSTYEQFEKWFIRLRNSFKGKLQDISDSDYEFLNRSEMRKKSVEHILTCASSVARKFQEAQENNRLDRVGCIDALENLIYAMKNLLFLIDNQHKISKF